MPFEMGCKCGQYFMAEEHLIGQTVSCPSCSEPLLIQPAESPAPQPAPQNPAAQQQPPTLEPVPEQPTFQHPAPQQHQPYPHQPYPHQQLPQQPAQPQPFPQQPSAQPQQHPPHQAAPQQHPYPQQAPVAGQNVQGFAPQQGVAPTQPNYQQPTTHPHQPNLHPSQGYSQPVQQAPQPQQHSAPQQQEAPQQTRADEKPSSSKMPLIALGMGGGMALLLALAVGGYMYVTRADETNVANNDPVLSVPDVAPEHSSTTIGDANPIDSTSTDTTDTNTGVNPPTTFSSEVEEPSESPFVEEPATDDPSMNSLSTSTTPSNGIGSSTNSSDDETSGTESTSTTDTPSPKPDEPHKIAENSLEAAAMKWQESGKKQLGMRRINKSGLPYRQYGWMYQMLPHLGHQKTYDAVDFSKPWSDRKNIVACYEVIPQFLNRDDERVRWEGYQFRGMGLSHFVGMSGVEDSRNDVAATFPRDDPRAGVFGYDAVASQEDITDGTSQTIMIVGSGEITAPWAFGGGATVRGARAPYFEKLTGFGSRGSSPGTMAVMADGSVRFISEDMDPQIFRSMCTIAGNDSVDKARRGSSLNQLRTRPADYTAESLEEFVRRKGLLK